MINPNILYDLQAQLEPYQIFTEEEVQAVNQLEIKGGFKKSTKAQTELNAWIDKGVERFKQLNEEEKDAFKALATKIVRTYAFILQIATFIDANLHKLYIYLNYLLRKLPRSINGL